MRGSRVEREGRSQHTAALQIPSAPRSAFRRHGRTGARSKIRSDGLRGTSRLTSLSSVVCLCAPCVSVAEKMEDLASPSPSVVVVLASFNGVARQSRRGAARSRLTFAFTACRRRACRICCRPLLVCRGCARLRVGQSLLLPLETRRVGAVRAPRSSQLAWRLTPTFGCGKWPAAVSFSSTGGSGRSRRPAFRVRSSDYGCASCASSCCL